MTDTNRNVAPVTDAALDALERIAAQATRGTWAFGESYGYQWLKADIDGSEIISIPKDGDGWYISAANGEFIAAANPDTVRRLVTALREARTLNARYVAAAVAGCLIGRLGHSYYYLFPEQGDTSELFDTPEQALADFERVVMGKSDADGA